MPASLPRVLPDYVDAHISNVPGVPLPHLISLDGLMKVMCQVGSAQRIGPTLMFNECKCQHFRIVSNGLSRGIISHLLADFFFIWLVYPLSYRSVPSRSSAAPAVIERVVQFRTPRNSTPDHVWTSRTRTPRSPQVLAGRSPSP